MPFNTIHKKKSSRENFRIYNNHWLLQKDSFSHKERKPTSSGIGKFAQNPSVCHRGDRADHKLCTS